MTQGLVGEVISTRAAAPVTGAKRKGWPASLRLRTTGWSAGDEGARQTGGCNVGRWFLNGRFHRRA